VESVTKHPFYVYFAESKSAGLIKIGFTSCIEQRLRNEPFVGPLRNVKVLGMIKGGRDREREIHFRFRAFRRDGEWFEASPELREFISARAIPFDRWSARFLKPKAAKPPKPKVVRGKLKRAPAIWPAPTTPIVRPTNLAAYRAAFVASTTIVAAPRLFDAMLTVKSLKDKGAPVRVPMSS
jgi:hypothetical protein